MSIFPPDILKVFVLVIAISGKTLLLLLIYFMLQVIQIQSEKHRIQKVSILDFHFGLIDKGKKLRYINECSSVSTPFEHLHCRVHKHKGSVIFLSLLYIV
jgi:hypothetical protein